ncbi:sigma-70 region 2 family protein [Talaromyces stipitatus ATCC 10500]|uniref:Sigma-70 region 2 family protein n=1 Tax=Talaromyces stipitatus (strain ATCC 10500 / CBS 375.48 / QM 6759 / NRRL 1006) TaxID=441959 RepID=B8M820_TALSN|nr:sigma-70 region 2 family protein [Talaromyces stipitatus ATCC 10500]EED19982.1 sigma-70 region 2 family protein [Talaromyces stipitatus ATCC 10500]
MPPNRWQFIDLSKDSADNLTQVKRHVMQEYMRQKRMETQQQEGQDDEKDSDLKGSTKKTRRPRTKTIKPTKDKDSITGGKPQRQTATSGTARDAEGTEARGAFRIVTLPHGGNHRYTRSDYSDFSSSSSFARYPDTSNDLDNYTIDFGTDFQRTPPQPTRSVMLSPPRTVLSAARTDPFDTLPWHATKEDQRLFDFYVNEMPSLSYGHQYRTKRAHNWYTEIFVPEAMKGALTFVNTVLVHAANTWAWVRNENETDSTLRYRQLAISMLRDHMQKYPHDTTDNVITACMSAAALEDFDPRPEHKEISWIHMRQAQKLIRRRGGPIAFQNTKLARLINWQDYILAGYVSDPESFHYEDENSYFHTTKTSPIGSSTTFFPSPPNSASPITLDSSPSPTYPRFANSAEEEIALQCEEFINFLTRCEHLSLNQRMTLSSKDAPVRYSAFGSGSTLFRILASPAEKRRTLTGDRKQFLARMAALMMLNAALWDYRYSVLRTEAFIEHAVLQLRDSEVNVDASVEALLQILLACKDFAFTETMPYPLHTLSLPSASRETGDVSQYPEMATSPFDRPWFVGRMLKVAKRLGLQSWLRLNHFLLECLTLQVQEHTMLSWESDLRREILQAPLTSYVMPALQEAVFLGI